MNALNSNQDVLGRFVKGNKAAVGRNPSARTLKRQKSLDAIILSTRVEDVLAIWAATLTEAKAGEPWAIKFVLEFLFGNAIERENAERLDDLQSLICQSEAA